MRNIKWVFVLYAFIATAAIMSIGIFIGEGSALGVILAIAALIVVMGLGFTTKKKCEKKGSCNFFAMIESVMAICQHQNGS